MASNLDSVSKLRSLNKGLVTIIEKMRVAREKDAPNDLLMLTYRYKSNARNETHQTNESAYGLFREISGTKSRQAEEVNDQYVNVNNKTFERTTEISQDDLDDDQTGTIIKNFDSVYPAYIATIQNEIADYLDNGETRRVNDDDTTDVFFRSTGTNPNLRTGTGTTETNIASDLRDARVNIMTQQTSEGRLLGTYGGDLWVVCHPTLTEPIRRVVESNVIRDGYETNTLKTYYKGVIESPFFGDTNDYYVFIKNPAYKPLIFQERMGLQVNRFNPNMLYEQRKYVWNVNARFAVAPGLRSTIIKVTNS